jgi:hypothetical protein
MESLTAFKRAGATGVTTYFARQAAQTHGVHERGASKSSQKRVTTGSRTRMNFPPDQKSNHQAPLVRHAHHV